MKIIDNNVLAEDQALLADIEALIVPDEHHDGANLMRCALVSLVYGFGFGLQDLTIFDRRNFGLYVNLLDYYRARGETADLRRLGEQARDYLLSSRPTMERFNAPALAKAKQKTRS